MESYTRELSEFMSKTNTPQGYWYSVISMPSTCLSLAELLQISDEELMDVLQVIGLVGRQQTRNYKFNRTNSTNFVCKIN